MPKSEQLYEERSGPARLPTRCEDDVSSRHLLNAPPMPPVLATAVAELTFRADDDAPAAPELPVEVIIRVLAFARSVRTLCAAACVARAWRAATREPHLWHNLDSTILEDSVVEKLTAPRLAYFLSAGGVRTLHLNRRAPALTAHDVADALADARAADAPRLSTLSVRVMRCGKASQGQPNNPIRRLAAATRHRSNLDVAGGGLCSAIRGEFRCKRLCSDEDLLCDECSLHCCERCLCLNAEADLLEPLRQPPESCGHLCWGCWAREDERPWCDTCRQAHFCYDCLFLCQFCEDKLLCRSCVVSCDYCDAELCRACAAVEHEQEHCFGCEGRECKCYLQTCWRCHDGPYCKTCADEKLLYVQAEVADDDDSDCGSLLCCACRDHDNNE